MSLMLYLVSPSPEEAFKTQQYLLPRIGTSRFYARLYRLLGILLVVLLWRLFMPDYLKFKMLQPSPLIPAALQE